MEAVTEVPRVANQSYMGNVKSWRTDKGYGFLTVQDGGKDVFVHQSAIMVEASAYRAILPGTEVMFVLDIRDGKETATDVKNKDGTLLKGFVTKLEATQQISLGPVEPGTKKGKVKFFNQDKGFGFITPEEVGAEEIFFNIADVQGRVTLQSEESVRYLIGEGNKAGTTQARNIKRVGVAPLAPQGGGHPGAGEYNPYGAPPPQPYAPYAPQQPAPGYPAYGGFYGQQPPPSASPYMPQGGGGGGAQLMGSIKWYNQDKGFGFIVPGNGDKDVYFKSDAITDGTVFTEGQEVTYDMREQDSKSWATNVARARPDLMKKRKADSGLGYPDSSGYKIPRSDPGQYGQVGAPQPGSAYPSDPAAAYSQYQPPAAQGSVGQPAPAQYYGGAAAAAGQYPGQYANGGAYDPYGSAPQAGAATHQHPVAPSQAGHESVGQQAGYPYDARAGQGNSYY